MVKPKFCPNCGKKLQDKRGWIIPISLPLSSEKDEITPKVYDGGYDIWCDLCEYSGIVFPDDEATQVNQGEY